MKSALQKDIEKLLRTVVEICAKEFLRITTNKIFMLFFHNFFPFDGNSARISSRRAERILSAASVIFCPDDGFHGRASVLILPGILQSIFWQNVLILCGGGGIVRATHDVNELYF